MTRCACGWYNVNGVAVVATPRLEIERCPSEAEKIEHRVEECIAFNSFGHLLAVKPQGAEWEMA